MPEREKRCETCKWWERHREEGVRPIPITRSLNKNIRNLNFPTCNKRPESIEKAAYEWCGEWEPREGETGKRAGETGEKGDEHDG